MNLRKKKNQYSYHNEQHYHELDQYEDYPRGNNRKLSMHIMEDNTYYAKLLVKFLNQINQNCREHKRQSIREKEKKIPNEDKPTSQVKKKVKIQPPANQVPASVNMRKYSNQVVEEKTTQSNIITKKESEEHSKKQNKELYRFKDQHPQQNLKNLIPNPPPQIKPSKNMNEFFYSNIPQSYLPLLQTNLLFNFNNNSNINLQTAALIFQQKQMFGQKIPPINYNFTEVKNNMNVNNLLQQNNLTNIKKQPQKTIQKKLFTRSAYHVAIAYHIHIKKIQSRGKEKIGPNEIDPTYFAKRLREKKQDLREDVLISQKPSMEKSQKSS